jgi:DNA-binding transcriptional MerR regulator
VRDARTNDGFPTPIASKLTGASVKTLENWISRGFLQPSIAAARGHGFSNIYSFRDLIAIRVAVEFRQAGVTLQMLGKVVAYLRDRDGLSATEALARTNLITDGERVYEVEGDVSIQLPSGQRTMNVTIVRLDQLVSEVQRKARALRRAA